MSFYRHCKALDYSLFHRHSYKLLKLVLRTRIELVMLAYQAKVIPFNYRSKHWYHLRESNPYKHFRRMLSYPLNERQLFGASGGTRTPTPKDWNLNPARLPITPQTHYLFNMAINTTMIKDLYTVDTIRRYNQHITSTIKEFTLNELYCQPKKEFIPNETLILPKMDFILTEFK